MFGLWAYAVAWPLLDLLGSNPTFFTFRGWGLMATLFLAVGITVIPPLLIWAAINGLRWLSPAVGQASFLITMAGLAAAATAPILGRLLTPLPTAGLAVGLGAGIAVAYNRFDPVARFINATAILSVLTLTLFIGSSSVDFLRSVPASNSPPSAGPETPNLLFVLLDELPTKSLFKEDGSIDPVRFPRIAEFADEATWYRYFTTQSTYTNFAVPSILTGTSPRPGQPLWTDHPNSLFSLLEPTHDLAVYESYTRLCPSVKCDQSAVASLGGDGSVSSVLGDVAGIWQDRLVGKTSADMALDEFSEEIEFQDIRTNEQLRARRPGRHAAFLEALAPSEAPVLWFEHLVLPHAPFHLYPDGAEYAALDTDEPHSNDLGSWHQRLLEHRHLLQASYTDQLVGETLDRLAAIGEYDETLIVVMADHGASFEEGTPFRQYVDGTADEHAYAPLLIKQPGQTEGRTDDQNLMSVDVLPTVAALLGVELDWAVDGYPADSPGIAARGSTKELTRIEGSGSFDGVASFDAEASFPTFDDRWVGSLAPNEQPLSALLRSLGSRDLFGNSAAPTREARISGSIDNAAELAAPDTERPPAFISGQVEDSPPGSEVLVIVNEIAVTGSPVGVLGGSDNFLAMMPLDLLGLPMSPELVVRYPDGSLEPARLQ